MLDEIVIGKDNASLLGDPKTVRQYIKRLGEGKFVVYGFSGFLAADSIDKETSEKIAQAKLPNVAYFSKPVGTIYCTDGKGDSYTITDGLKIAKLDADASREELVDSINAITDKKAYFIGESIVGARKGVFTALANYYNNLLSPEEFEKYGDIFADINGELRLSDKGNDMLELFKETWDYTPREIRSLCKLDIRPLISKLFGDLSEGIPIELEYLKEQARGEATPDELRKFLESDVNELKSIIDKGKKEKYLSQSGISKSGKVELNALEYQLQDIEGLLNRKIDINKIFKGLLYLAPESIRPKKSKNFVPSENQMTYYELRNDWRKSLESAINVVRTRVSQIKLYGIDPARQLELLEKGGYLTIYETFDSNLNTHTMIYRGQNFRYINDVGGAFCPMGLSEKWDTWKIERLGRDITLTKYFKNFKGELLRVSANGSGEVMIEGSAEPVFDEATAKEISMIEEMINYGLPSEERIPFKLKPFEPSEPKGALKSSDAISRTERIKEPKKPKITGIRKSDERLLDKIKRHRKY